MRTVVILAFGPAFLAGCATDVAGEGPVTQARDANSLLNIDSKVCFTPALSTGLPPTYSLDESQRTTDDDLRAHGRRRAEAEYHDGWAEIEGFGEGRFCAEIDEESGLYNRWRGCGITHRDYVESKAYNKRIRELVAETGPPFKARELKARFNRLRNLMAQGPDLAWLPVPRSKSNASAMPTTVGLFEAVVETTRSISQLRIRRVDTTLATVRVGQGETIAVALLPTLDILAIRVSGRVDTFLFVDTRHNRFMWRYRTLDPSALVRRRAYNNG